MKAAVISERGAPPVVQQFREPMPREGAVMIDMDTAGLGGWDVLGAYLSPTGTLEPVDDRHNGATA